MSCFVLCAFYFERSPAVQCGAERQLLSLPLWVASRINQQQIVF